MLRPSYTDLLDVINQETDDITLGSRYTIVIAAAKRARPVSYTHLDVYKRQVWDFPLQSGLSAATTALFW